MSFRKLISNLPFNPSLVSQVAFYGRRAREESSLRRLGFLLIIFAMFIQMVAVIAPPERSLAASPNHILDGVRTKADLLAAWDRPGSDISAIYGKFGVTRDNIANLTNTPNVTIRSNAGPDYWTTGRTSLSSYSNVKTEYKNTEIALTAGGTTFYMRQLRAWDIKNPYNLYAAWQGTKNDGSVFWIFQDCGNYTQPGKFTPKTPGLELKKTIVGSTNLKPGDTYSFRFEYRNPVPDSLAENVVLEDLFDLDNFDIVSPAGLPINGGHYMTLPLGNVAYTPNYNVIDVTVRLKNPFPGDKTLCNAAKMTATNATEAWGGPACVNVTIPCQYDASIPASDARCKPPVTPCVYDSSIPSTDPKCVKPTDVCTNIDGNQATVPAGKVQVGSECIDVCKYNPSIPSTSAECVAPKVYCSLLDTSLDRATRTATFKTTVTSTNEAATKIVSYTYDFGDGKPVTVRPSTALTDTTSYTYAAGEFNASVVVAYTVTGENGTTKKTDPCSDRISFEADKPLGESKTVKNITQNLDTDKTVNSTVHAGDVLEYSLTTSNTQDYVRSGITVSDYIGDVLDYATIDTDFLKQQGGTFDDASKKVIWEGVSIPAKNQVVKTFRVKIKDPIPATNTPSSTSGTFDCKISNKYGNETNMSVACPVVKGVESLPNTGPGTTVVFGCAVTMVVGYFFARSRILARELELIKQDYAPAGGC